MAGFLDDRDWDLLITRIRAGKCTPFLGAGAGFGFLPLGGKVAEEWAQKYDYPLHDRTDLPRVAQYVAIMHDGMFPKDEISNRFKSAPPPDFTQPDEPHALLADLNLPIYLTTNYDDFMVRALQSRHRDPKVEYCRWNSLIQREETLFETEKTYVPSVANPLVYYLHGKAGNPESLVLTEDDYLDFMRAMAGDDTLLPRPIEKALSDTSLLFLGYSIGDWDFRVLFRILLTYLEKALVRKHVSVQLVPVQAGATDKQKDAAQRYLDQYFGKLEIKVYWDTCRAFTAELRKRLGSAARV